MTCTHHWRIASPEGPTSKGRCKLCGAERDFLNSYGDYDPIQRSLKAHTQYCTSGEKLGARLMAEAYRE